MAEASTTKTRNFAMDLTMTLSDVLKRNPKLIYRNHSTLLVLNEAATRRSNRFLGDLNTTDIHQHGGPMVSCERRK